MLKKLVITFMLGIMVFTGANLFAAGNASNGEKLAKGCKCHKGELEGWSEEKLTQTLTDFKTGKLINKFMNKKAASLSDQDIADLATWFASQK
ncbi:c-type cytochrome [Desulfovibrio ferrophilus]|uniref:Cytochrome c553 n=1 Tax=Desulfovibrio ferrophilus TaxID=241368 RepID=A0A2Z6AY60_9BACT|nr:cytochrome C [Desulfovibrio ferrophilus]BBD08191.1 cytochrome c553 [Desulfovibrio ferrophilus]